MSIPGAAKCFPTQTIALFATLIRYTTFTGEKHNRLTGWAHKASVDGLFSVQTLLVYCAKGYFTNYHLLS